MIETEIVVQRNNCGRICALSPCERRVKEFINLVAEKFSELIRGKAHRIKTRTLEDEKQKGKLDVIERVEDYLYGACPKDFKGKTREEIGIELQLKISGLLADILEANRDSSKEYREGMNPALKMIGGYFLRALSLASAEN